MPAVLTVRAVLGQHARCHASQPITGAQTVLPVLGRTIGRGRHRLAAGHAARAPERSTGLDRAAAEPLRATTSWRIVVKTASRRLLVYRSGRLVRSFSGDRRQALDAHSARAVLRRGERAHAPGQRRRRRSRSHSARTRTCLQDVRGRIRARSPFTALRTWAAPSGPRVSHGCVRLADQEHSLAGRAHRAGRARGDHLVSDFHESQQSSRSST